MLAESNDIKDSERSRKLLAQAGGLRLKLAHPADPMRTPLLASFRDRFWRRRLGVLLRRSGQSRRFT